ncbi:MAG: type 1 glutamine amidotransferase domain-containing protein [Acidimicrobiales bacterium]
MANDLAGKKVAFLVANEGIEEVELVRPWEAVVHAGGEPYLVAPKEGEARAVNHLEPGDLFKVDRTTAEVSPEEYDCIVLPGGVANPDKLRMDHPAVELVRSFFSQGKPVAAICHGPWTLVEADVVRGRTLTSWPSLQTDIRNAGGRWVDAEAHRDGNLLTSRKPADLDAFCGAMIDLFRSGTGSRAA